MYFASSNIYPVYLVLSPSLGMQDNRITQTNRIDLKQKNYEFLKREFLINVLRKSTNWMQLLVLICSAGVMMSVIKSSSGGSKGSKRSNLTERGKGHKVKCITT